MLFPETCASTHSYSVLQLLSLSISQRSSCVFIAFPYFRFLWWVTHVRARHSFSSCIFHLPTRLAFLWPRFASSLSISMRFGSRHGKFSVNARDAWQAQEGRSPIFLSRSILVISPLDTPPRSALSSLLYYIYTYQFRWFSLKYWLAIASFRLTVCFKRDILTPARKRSSCYVKKLFQFFYIYIFWFLVHHIYCKSKLAYKLIQWPIQYPCSAAILSAQKRHSLAWHQ